MNEYYHCKNQEQFEWLMKKMEKDYNINPFPSNYWGSKKEKTVIHLEKNRIYKISFQTIDYFKDKDITDFINVGELMEKEREENMPTKNVDEFLKKKIFIKVSDDINIELQAGELKIQSQVRENWIKDLRRGLDLIDNVLDYFESETKDAD